MGKWEVSGAVPVLALPWHKSYHAQAVGSLSTGDEKNIQKQQRKHTGKVLILKRRQ